MEMQLADYRYNTSAKDSELTGGIYRPVVPTKQVYKPTEWNTVHVELKGDRLKATINGELIQDIDLSRRIRKSSGMTDPSPRQSRTGPGVDTLAFSSSAEITCRYRSGGPDQDGLSQNSRSTVEMLLEAGDDQIRDRDRHDCPPGTRCASQQGRACVICQAIVGGTMMSSRPCQSVT